MNRVQLAIIGRVIGLMVLASPIALVFASFFDNGYVTLPLKAAVAALAIATVMRPASALLAVAGLLPLSTMFTFLSGTTISGAAVAEVVVLAFLLGMIVRAALSGWKGVPVDTAIAIPALLFGAVVAVSAWIGVMTIAYEHSSTALAIAAGHLRNYVMQPADVRPLWEGALLLEGAGLLVATHAIASLTPGVTIGLPRMIAAGAAGAAALNVNRLVQAAVSTEAPLESLRRIAMTVRFNIHHGDLNAAAAYFLLTLPIVVGLVMASRRWRGRLGWLIAGWFIAAALWLAGSRSAFIAAGVAIVGVVLVTACRSWFSRRRIRFGKVALVTVLVALAAVAIAAHPRIRLVGRISGYDVATHERLVLVRAALKMVATGPVFGIGVGEFYPNSARFTWPERPAGLERENAHNNFLQILAELGIAGFGLFLCLIAVPLGRAWQALRTAKGKSVLGGIAVGVIAFLTASMAMHPLLVREVAYQFWIVLGALGGLANLMLAGEAAPPRVSAPQDVRPSGRWLGAATAAIFMLMATVPFRSARAIQSADLEGSVGFSPLWQTWSEGTRYRFAGPVSTLFVPGEVAWVLIPLRAPEGSGPIQVEVLLDGAPADAATVPDDRWLPLRVILPQRRSAPRSRRLDLRASMPGSAAGTGIQLMVGKPVFPDQPDRK